MIYTQKHLSLVDITDLETVSSYYINIGITVDLMFQMFYFIKRTQLFTCTYIKSTYLWHILTNNNSTKPPPSQNLEPPSPATHAAPPRRLVSRRAGLAAVHDGGARGRAPRAVRRAGVGPHARHAAAARLGAAVARPGR